MRVTGDACLSSCTCKPSLLVEQPGDSVVNQFISISRSDDPKTIVAYVPAPVEVSIRNLQDERYEGQWFDAVANKTSKATLTYQKGILRVSSPRVENDHVLVLHKIK
jgi:hypothetical protein